MAFYITSIFFITLIISFVGTLPFGPINLIMIDTTLKNNFRAGFWFAVAAALVEMGQSVIALYGSSFISKTIEKGPWVQIAGFLFFLLLGTLFLLKKNTADSIAPENVQNGFFRKGLVVAMLNPQAIPFWVIVLAILQSTPIATVTSQRNILLIVSFALAAASGKLGALLLFGILSERIISRSTLIRTHINRIIGFILIIVGVFQGILAFIV